MTTENKTVDGVASASRSELYTTILLLVFMILYCSYSHYSVISVCSCCSVSPGLNCAIPDHWCRSCKEG